MVISKLGQGMGENDKKLKFITAIGCSLANIKPEQFTQQLLNKLQ